MTRIEELMSEARVQQKTHGRNKERECLLYTILTDDGSGTDTEFRFLMPKPC